MLISLFGDGGRTAIHLDWISSAVGTKINKNIDVFEAKGIKNTGNICFASAVVQMLFRVKSIRNFVLDSSSEDLHGLRRLFVSLADPRVKVVKNHGGEFIPSRFALGEPGDSEEFYSTWTEKLEKVIPAEDLQSDLFLKISVNRTNPQIQKFSFSTDYWSAIRINFPDGPGRKAPIDLATLLDHSNGPFGEEKLTDTLILSHKIASFPNLVAFVFVRTAFDRLRGMIKIKTPVNTPEHLNLSKFGVNQEIEANYKLKMFVIHRGDIGGHYLAYIRDNENDWKVIDDDIVKSSSISDVMESVQMATICFYEKN